MKTAFKEFNFNHTITIRNANGKIENGNLYSGYIDGLRVTKHYSDFDECLDVTRNILDNPPEWVAKKIN